MINREESLSTLPDFLLDESKWIKAQFHRQAVDLYHLQSRRRQ